VRGRVGQGARVDRRYVDTLRRGAEALGLPLDDALAAGLATHHALVVRWASKMNLTTVVEPERAAIVHGLDSLLFAAAVPPDLADDAIDVGSGAGFPGIPLALARPALRLTLLEPQRKRASFLRVALAELGRADVRVVEGRLDPVPPGRAPAFTAGLVVSRATVPPLELLAAAPPYVRPGGALVLSGGAGYPEADALAAAAGAAFAPEAASSYALPAVSGAPSGERRVVQRFARTSVDRPGVGG
jgi:16S rRNA (guanine527-N7)-methyltransferase